MSRSIFEDVGEAGPSGPAAAAGVAEAQKRQRRRVVSIWLFVLAAMVVAQILVGGLTRLTESGLSMVEWRPQGFLPPMSDAAWAEAFAKYQTTTEYQTVNAGMSVDEFKTIYWWEWGHRTWGRLIGLVFLIPFAIFLFRKTIPTGWMGRIVLVGALGALQGVIGWWMVASGLTGRIDVSQYRLAVHLGLAFVILGLLLWYALSLRRDDFELLAARRRREKGLFAFAGVVALLLFLQIIVGAFVAGLRAWEYGDWPTMGNALFPPGEAFIPFEEKAATQFVHRKLGYILAIVTAVFWWRARGSAFAKTRRWASILFGVLIAQIVIGIVTLTHGVPLSMGVMHQATAVALFAVLIHAKHQIAFPAEEKISTS